MFVPHPGVSLCSGFSVAPGNWLVKCLMPNNRDRATLGLNGSACVIRRVSPDDSDKLYKMHQRLSRESLYLRYLAYRRPTMDEMITVCGLSVGEGAAFVAQRKDKDDEIVGLAYYRFDPHQSDENPEFAIVVEDRYQGRGIGKALLKGLIRHAAADGVRQLKASIHSRNRPMIGLLYHMEYPLNARTTYDTIEATIDLQSAKESSSNGFFGFRHLADPFAGLHL